MKPNFINLLLFAGSFFLIQTANAQFDTDLFSQQELQQKLLHKSLQKPTVEHSSKAPELVLELQLDSTFVPRDALKKHQSRLLTPNSAWHVKNKSQNNSSGLALLGKKTTPDILYQKRRSGNVSFQASITEHNLQLNKGSKDPGIFYAPEEGRNPAAIIIKPLKDIDPEMVIDPDQLN